jgi:hypothetical protein
MAGNLAGIELTEQLTPSATERIRNELKPGPKTSAALGLLSDCSAFLNPPPDEVASQSPPDLKAQQAMLNRASDFALNALRHLPDFLATRTTRSFESSSILVSNRKVDPDHSDATAESDRFSVQSPFFAAGTFNREITYREGHELSGDSVLATGQRLMPSAEPLGLVSSGEFGSELATILLDVEKGQISWDHWEQTSAGLTAVFHYTVPPEAANYSVDFCCVRHFENGGPHPKWTIRVPGVGDITNSYRGTPPYHGNLYLNLATGAVLRVTLVVELKESDPITQAASSVQYGPEEIGGKIFVLPLHGVVLSSFRTYSGNSGGLKTVLRINETSFANYHRFGSTVRILPTAPDPKPEN